MGQEGDEDELRRAMAEAEWRVSSGPVRWMSAGSRNKESVEVRQEGDEGSREERDEVEREREEGWQVDEGRRKKGDKRGRKGLWRDGGCMTVMGHGITKAESRKAQGRARRRRTGTCLADRERRRIRIGIGGRESELGRGIGGWAGD